MSSEREYYLLQRVTQEADRIAKADFNSHSFSELKRSFFGFFVTLRSDVARLNQEIYLLQPLL